MVMDLTGITNYNEFYTNHYLASIFADNAEATISAWRTRAKESDEICTPWALLRDTSRQFYTIHEKYLRSRSANVFPLISDMADNYLQALGYPAAAPIAVEVADKVDAPVYLEVKKPNGAPLLWVLLAHTTELDAPLMQGYCFYSDEGANAAPDDVTVTTLANEELATKILFGMHEPPRWLLFVSLNQIALIDRNKWNEKRYLHFDLEEIFRRREDTTFQAMAVLLHCESLCPADGSPLLDKLDDNSHRHAAGVSQDLKYALRESIELLGNEVLYDLTHRQRRDLAAEPVNASQLTIECLRYMYRLLFVLFIEARPELGYAPMKAQVYVQGYSLESLRDIADSVRGETSEVGQGYYLHETIAKLFALIYSGYPDNEAALKELTECESLHDIFVIDPLKAHIFDPDYTPLITAAKLRNSVMLTIIDLMSITRATGRRNDRRGRISYAALGINQMGAVYEALLSYRGFIAAEPLYEVKRAKDKFDELDVGYFVPERELANYTEEERVRYQSGEHAGQLRRYDQGAFIYRLAGREREKSASYYTPEVLTKCLVKYALKELLAGKTADDILHLTVCEPAMGSAAFLNESINQLAEAYLDRKQAELGETIAYDQRYQELQRVKMYIADRNVYGIDLNPVAVELAEVSLWLNTIYKGAYVPWFGLQLVNGNSLIGARKQCYRIEQLQATSQPGRWYDNAPDRILPGKKRLVKKQVYHFLLGDPGMASYSDKVIKSLAGEQIKALTKWNKTFVRPYNDEDMQTLLRLSAVVDSLWAKQVDLRKSVNTQTADKLSVYGHEDHMKSSRTTIREKDLIYQRLYKSEKMKNAGPYARLKFAMDYWCALWFWPIEQADLLPSRSEFLFDMSLILEGSIVTATKSQNRTFSLFPTEMDEMVQGVLDLYDDMREVDLVALCERNPRMQLAKEIAVANKFMHWELEFADLFEERGGFDLVIGNPPWIKMEWNEQAVLADRHPEFVVKGLTAIQTTLERQAVMISLPTRALYFSEYESIAGSQNFLNSTQNYSILKGIQTDLYKCFIPQAWMITNRCGVSAFIHPEGLHNDPGGGNLRVEVYKRLIVHFQFQNELRLFSDVHHNRMFSLNVYSNTMPSRFLSISNIFDANSIDQCFERKDGYVEGIKDEQGDWNKSGHIDRLISISRKELLLFARLFNNSIDINDAKLPAMHTRQMIETLRCFDSQDITIFSLKDEVHSTQMWNETYAEKKGYIVNNVRFPDSHEELVCSGPHIGVSNPNFKTPRASSTLNSDYDVIDNTAISSRYIQRTKYSPNLCKDYTEHIAITPWNTRYTDDYRIFARKMIDPRGERTLISAIYPPGTAHIHGVIGFSFKDTSLLPYISGLWASVPYDFFIKIMNKANLHDDNTGPLPIPKTSLSIDIKLRALLLNSISKYYDFLWRDCWQDEYISGRWSKNDPRLNPARFTSLTPDWTWHTPLRTDYERRQALVEIDVLTAMALGMTIDQLKTIYRIQFPVLQSYEADTWYDRTGRIVFTNNRSLTNVGFSRPEWNEIKDAQSGTFTRTITDDTMPGGPVERTIEYVAPFDRCDREQDYETAWAFFAERFKAE